MVWSAACPTFVHSLLSPVATGCGFGGLSPPNWKVKHYVSVEFLLIFTISCPRTNEKLPYWKLSGDGSESAADSSFVHKKPNLTQMKK